MAASDPPSPTPEPSRTSPKPPAPQQPEREPAANTPSASPSPATLAAFTEHLTSLLGDIVTDVVRETLEIERDRQAAQLHALLEQQDARLEALLDHQARRHAAEMAALMERHVEILLSNHHEAPPEPISMPPATAPDPRLPEIAAEIRETLRLGFAELCTGLVQHQHAMTQLAHDELHPRLHAALSQLEAQPQPLPCTNLPTSVFGSPKPAESPPFVRAQRPSLQDDAYDDDPTDIPAWHPPPPRQYRERPS